MINQLSKTWIDVYAEHGITVDFSQTQLPVRQGKQNLPLFVPGELGEQGIETLFVSAAAKHAECGLFTHHADKMNHKRSPKEQSYIRWVTVGAYEHHGTLYEGTHDDSMTLCEKYLHEIWMWHTFGGEYKKLFPGGYNHDCCGTWRGDGRVCTLEYDPYDVKFATRFWGLQKH